MHLQVDMSLGHLSEQIVFEEKIAASDKKNPESTLTPETISKFHALFDQCVASCSSPIPLKISKPFDLIDHKIQLFMGARKLFRKGGDVLFWTSYAYHETYAEVSNGVWWQVNLPSTKKTLENVEKTLEKEWMKIKTNLEENNLCISDEMRL